MSLCCAALVVRVAGAALLMAGELDYQDPLLFAGAYALTNAGVSPLIMVAAELLYDLYVSVHPLSECNI